MLMGCLDNSHLPGVKCGGRFDRSVASAHTRKLTPGGHREIEALIGAGVEIFPCNLHPASMHSGSRSGYPLLPG